MATADYVKTSWVDNTTPVDATRMNHLETGVDLATDGVIALETRMTAEEALPDIPTVVNGQWIKGVGGVPVWSAIAIADIATLQGNLDSRQALSQKGVANGYAPLDSSALVPVVNLPPVSLAGATALATNVDAAAANIDIAWTSGAALLTQISLYPNGGGSIRNLAVPTNGAGTRVIFRNATASSVTIKNGDTGGTGKALYTRTGTALVLGIGGETAEFLYDGTQWVEVNRDVAAGAGGGADWEGAWSSSFPYVKGDVVTYNGVTYIAVNDSTNVAPSGGTAGVTLGTTFPVAPIDGQTFTLVDSLTAPTYSWRFQYVAAKATNKWVFIGGAPGFAEVVAAAVVASAGAYLALTGSPGPSFTLPVAGDYDVTTGHEGGNSGGSYMSFDIGATGAVDADSTFAAPQGASSAYVAVRTRRKTGLTAVTLTAKYKSASTVETFRNRWIRVAPVAVGG